MGEAIQKMDRGRKRFVSPARRAMMDVEGRLALVKGKRTGKYDDMG